MIDVEAMYREAKLPKYMRDTDSGREALGRLVAAALEEAARVCDAKFAQRSEGGFPREASTARKLGEEIRALKPS